MSASRVAREPDLPAAASAEAVRAELERVIGSARFAASERHRRLLRFVVEETLAGRGSSIKELVLAMEVFGRDSSFDPRTDSIVRSEARNLRARLDEYYRNEGNGDPVVIDLPKGSYVPVFRAIAVERSPSRFLRSLVITLAAGVLVVAVAAGWLLRPGVRGAAERSIAVLPFLNLTGSGDSDYAVDGFVEDLTTDLARLPGLRVAARTSAFQYRGRNTDVRRIGQELGVDAVLEGSLRQEQGAVKITAQLVSTRNGYHLWSNSYQREPAGEQEAEREIVTSVGQALGIRPRAGETARHVPLPEAREAYWRGRYLYADWQRVPDSVPFFEQAVKADPLFAEAWAALALAHSNLAFHLAGNVDEETAEMKAAARRALSLDSAIPEAYSALAVASYSYDHDWPAAEQGYRRALEVNPSYVGGHRGFALALVSRGRFREAIEHLETAQQLDPLSVLATNNLATTLYCARRYDVAIRVAHHHLEMDPHFFPAWVVIAQCEAEKSSFREALAALEKAKAEGGTNDTMVLGPLGHALAHTGRTQEAAAVVAQLRSIQGATANAEVQIAAVLTALGEKRQAIESLGRAADRHVTDVTFIGVNPVFDPLRGEPDFLVLCARLGLPSQKAGTNGAR